jgi:hypothetical protein
MFQWYQLMGSTWPRISPVPKLTTTMRCFGKKSQSYLCKIMLLDEQELIQEIQVRPLLFFFTSIEFREFWVNARSNIIWMEMWCWSFLYSMQYSYITRRSISWQSVGFFLWELNYLQWVKSWRASTKSSECLQININLPLSLCRNREF